MMMKGKTAKKVKHQTTETEAWAAAPVIELVARKPVAALFPEKLFVAPLRGSHYHVRERCGGLGSARQVVTLTPCGTCVKTRTD